MSKMLTLVLSELAQLKGKGRDRWESKERQWGESEWVQLKKDYSFVSNIKKIY